MECIEFQSIYKERVWGGRRLGSVFGRDLPGGVIGEAWEVVDREGDESVSLGGVGIGELLTKEVMGPGWEVGRRFPLIVKWLDCEADLSIQVHPVEGETKTEAWYVVEAREGSRVIMGLKEGVSRGDFEGGLLDGSVEGMVHSEGVGAGDSVFIPSGRVHAIGGGSLILEVQENSDVTYRVWDWGRGRDLHVEEAMGSIDFGDFEPGVNRGGEGVLVECGVFRMRKVDLGDGGVDVFGSGEEPRIISVVGGGVRVRWEGGERVLGLGANVLLPYGGDFEVEGMEGGAIIVTDRFV